MRITNITKNTNRLDKLFKLNRSKQTIHPLTRNFHVTSAYSKTSKKVKVNNCIDAPAQRVNRPNSPVQGHKCAANETKVVSQIIIDLVIKWIIAVRQYNKSFDERVNLSFNFVSNESTTYTSLARLSTSRCTCLSRGFLCLFYP